jgi:hypothetical protein
MDETGSIDGAQDHGAGTKRSKSSTGALTDLSFRFHTIYY